MSNSLKSRLIALTRSPWPHVAWWLATALHYGRLELDLLLLGYRLGQQTIGHIVLINQYEFWGFVPLSRSITVLVPPLLNLYPAWLLACVVTDAAQVRSTDGAVFRPESRWRRWWRAYRAYADARLGRRWRHVAPTVAALYVVLVLAWLLGQAAFGSVALMMYDDYQAIRRMALRDWSTLWLLFFVPAWLAAFGGLTAWAAWPTFLDRSTP